MRETRPSGSVRGALSNERPYRDSSFALFTGSEGNPKPSVFGLHAEAEFVEPIFVYGKHLCDAGDGEDVTDSRHGQAAI
jgi:hypothetical protein